MINSNPETVSTDYDTADKLYFEPLSWNEVKSVLDREKPDSVIIQLGGQTPLKLAKEIHNAGFNICLLYTSPSPRDATLSRMPSSA